ncbi:hypothetical protein GCM10009415_44280 [Chitinophaga japonensis]
MCACNFSAGVKKDLRTGLSIRNDHLHYSDYTLLRNGEPLKNRTIQYGDKITLRLDGVGGFTREMGYVYPDLSVIIRKKNGQPVEENKDLLENKPYTPQQVSLVETYYVPAPGALKAGIAYELEFRIKDKKGKGAITATLPVTVKMNKVNRLTLKQEGLNGEAMIYADAGPVINNIVPLKGRAGMICWGLKGFREEQGRVFPGGRISLLDPATGKVKMETADLFAGRTDGMSLEQVASGLTMFLNLQNPSLQGDKSIWQFELWDKKGPGRMQARVLLQLE